MACDVVYVSCCVVLSPAVLCCVEVYGVLWCVEVYGVLCGVLWCSVPSFRSRRRCAIQNEDPISESIGENIKTQENNIIP